MAKKPSKDINLTVNSVALETYTDSVSLNVEQETPEVTAFGDAGPRRVVGNYDYSLDLAGGADFASGAVDATLFGLVGSTGVAFGLDPTGASAGANDPNYDSTSAVLGSYSISGAVGEAVTYSATLHGNSALTRATS